jgi:hypothetical protein
MKKDPKIFLQHILESIEKIEEYIKNMSKQEFLNSSQTQDAVIRRIEIIGEAAKNIPEELKRKTSRHPMEKNSRNARHPNPRILRRRPRTNMESRKRRNHQPKKENTRDNGRFEEEIDG